MELDSLELKVSAEAQSAEKALDSLIGKLQSFSKALGGINTTSISKNLENLAKVGGLKIVTKEVEDLGKTVDNVGKKKTKTEVKVDVKQGLEAIAELQKRFENADKDIRFTGSTKQLEKQYDRLSNSLSKLFAKENAALDLGKASTGDEKFVKLERNIQSTINQLDTLKSKITEVQKAEQASKAQFFERENAKANQENKTAMMIPPESEMKKAAETYQKNMEKISSDTLPKHTGWDSQAELLKALKQSREGTAGALEGYDERIKKATADLKAVEKSGKGMGTEEWNNASIALRKVVAEAKWYENTLKEAAADLGLNVKSIKELEAEESKLVQKSNQLAGKGLYGSTDYNETIYQLGRVREELDKQRIKITGASSALQGYDERISQAKINLANIQASGKGMGTSEWDTAKMALIKLEDEARRYKAALNQKALGLDTDIKSTDNLETKIKKLNLAIEQMRNRGIGFGDTNFDKLYQQLNQAEKELAEYKARLTESENSTRSFGSTLKSAATGFSNFISKIKNAGAATLNFAKNVRNMKSPLKLALGQISKLGNSVARLYFKYMMLSRVAGALGKVLGISSDYVEEYNYFQKAIDKIAQENKGNYKKYGYDDAKSYADSFEDRLTTLTGKMTGYKPDKNGNLIDTDVASLGLDITQVTNFEAQIAQMTNSVGMMGEASIATSKAMTMLAGDMSSLTNMPLDTVMKNFSSGLSGAAMAVKKYGMDISVAALQETALGLGVKKNVSDMTQAEKEYLRVITMLQQSKVAWGDLAKTINSPANQFRMLKSNIKQCGLMLSRLFMPVIQKVLPWLNAMAMAVKDLMKHIGDLFGLKFDSSLGSTDSGTSDTYDDVSDSANNAADSINNAADAQKKFNKQLQGFDKLNNLTTNETSKKDSDKDKNGTGDVSGVLSDALINAVEDYEKRWNKAFKSMTSDADKLKEKIEKLFTTAWDTGDGTEIGEALATTLNKGIDWVNENTSKWAKGLKKITSIMGTSLNGFVEKFKWKGLGKAIGNSIKGVLEAETNFFETVNWVNLGKGLSKTLNSAIKTGVLQSYFKSMASKLRAAIETAFGAITTFDFKGLGKALGQGINDFFKTMNKKNKQTGLSGWQELGKSLSDGIKGIADSITTALDTVDWEQVGQAIADFIGSIDWGGVIWSLGKMAKSLVKAIGTTITAQTKEDPVSGIITIGILGFTLRKGWKKLLAILLGSKIGKSKLSVGLSRVFAVIKAWSISKISKAAKALATKIKSGIGKIVVTFKNVYASIKNWIANGAKISDVIKAVKTALGIQKGLTLSNIAVKIATKLPTLANPDMAADELARNIDEWFTNKIWKPLCKKVSWLDENSPMGVFQVPVKLAIKIGTTIKDFFGDTWDDTTAMTSGIDVGNDMANGVLKGFANALVYPANFLYNLIVKPVKEALGIHSPSTVFKEIAGFCVDGFMNNFNLKDKIKEKLQNLGKATIELGLKIKGSFDDKAKEIKEWWNGKKEKVKTLMAKAKGEITKKFEAVKEAWGKVKEGVKSLWAKAKATVEGAFNKVVEGWNNIKEGVKNLWAKAKGKIEATFNEAQQAWSDFKEGTKNIFVRAKGVVEDGFEKVSEAWGKIKGGTKEFWAKAKATISNKFDELSEKWGKIKSKDAIVTAKATIKDGVDKLGSIWKSVKTKTATLTGRAEEKTKDVFKSIKDKWKELTSKTAVLTATFKDMFTAPLKKAWNAIASAINKGIKTINKIPGVSIPSVPKLAKGGIFENGSWHNIAKYANGGMPNMGQLFVAREKGPELVSTLKGHTAVMNNDQIVASVSQGVSDAVYNVMTPVLTSLVTSINRMNSSGTPLYVEGVSEGDIVKITQNANSNYKKRYGKPLFT
jgi:phage-related protein|nr:MAG TPA: minor tail protein [Bacteriophage sp.]